MIIEENTSYTVIKPADVADIAQSLLVLEDETDRQKEHLWVLGLNTRHVVVYVELVSLGILDATLVHPREVFKTAITKSVHRIIAVHNHPSNECTPSQGDIETTQQLQKAGEVLGIPLIDHVIVSSSGYVSMKSLSLLD